MRAIAVDDFGAPARLHDLPVPEAGEGEIVVRVSASSVNGFDVEVARGSLEGVMDHHFPVVLGRDYAGTVVERGPGVGHLDVGAPVFGVVMGAELGPGTFAEQVVTPAAFAARRPEGLDVATGGALGLAGTTALNAIDAVDLAEGDTVLVSGATGGVGAFAVQLAAARRAQVIATAAPGDDEAFVRGLGATETVDHQGDLVAAVRALQLDGVDAVVHLAGDGPTLAGLCAPNGRLSSTLGLTAGAAGRDDVRVTPVIAQPTTGTLERLAAAVVSGSLVVPVQRTYRLDEAPQALEDFAGRKNGKLAIAVD
jgi:NADPH:quinone reductase-like Zn-dependent oxidoreductase